MFTGVVIAFVLGLLALVLGLVLGLTGWSGPTWAQRWGNVAAVLSLVALLLKLDAPQGAVLIPYFDTCSSLLGIFGAFWGATGDIVCRAATGKEKFASVLRKAINE